MDASWPAEASTSSLLSPLLQSSLQSATPSRADARASIAADAGLGGRANATILESGSPSRTALLDSLNTRTFELSGVPLLGGSAKAKHDRIAGVSLSHPWYQYSRWTKGEVDELLWANRTVVTAGTASLISTAASFPFDSLKSRLQVKHYPSVWSCGKAVFQEEGISGFFRGVTIPLITISFVRTSSFAIYVNTKSWLHKRGYVNDPNRLADTALSGAAGGATSGVIISCGSAPFELVKVMRQLEYLTAVQKGLVSREKGKFKARSGFAAAAEVYRFKGLRGFYIGFPLHLCRDTLGSAFYFGFYDSLRSVIRRHSKDDKTGLFGLPLPLVSFLTGSTAGIASWLFVYPVDLLKTNVQQRTLSNHPQQLTGMQLFTHLMRERPPPDPSRPDTLPRRFLRLYRGLGISALRSFISHGLTWTLIETIASKIAQRTDKSIDEVMGTR